MYNQGFPCVKVREDLVKYNCVAEEWGLRQQLAQTFSIMLLIL